MTETAESKLHDRLNAVIDKLAETNRLLAVMQSERAACQEQCRRVSVWAFGNGVRGADEILKTLERESVERRQSDADEAREHRQWRSRLWEMAPSIVTGVVVGAVLLLSQLAMGTF